MPYPHHYSMSSPATFVVRPGSSAALTARTIDATQRPVLTRATETVAQAAPQVVDSFRNAFTNPLFLSTLALSLVAVWILSRMRRQLSGLALGAMIVIASTSFSAPHKPKTGFQRFVDLAHTPRTTRNRMQSTSWNGYGYIAPQPQEEAVAIEQPEVPEVSVTPPTDGSDPVDIAMPATPVAPMPEWNDIRRNVERQAYRLMQERQIREIMARVRAQAREDARLRRWRREF